MSVSVDLSGSGDAVQGVTSIGVTRGNYPRQLRQLLAKIKAFCL